MAESKAILHVLVNMYTMNFNSTKSTGHLLGAAGAVETISPFLSYGIVPPTINHVTNDENIDSKLKFHVSTKLKKREMNVVMSNTFGFGGHNACVLVKN
jgi:3-oxoacyl-[acyl-carrier-protein] synthase II